MNLAIKELYRKSIKPHAMLRNHMISRINTHYARAKEHQEIYFINMDLEELKVAGIYEIILDANKRKQI